MRRIGRRADFSSDPVGPAPWSIDPPSVMTYQWWSSEFSRHRQFTPLDGIFLPAGSVQHLGVRKRLDDLRSALLCGPPVAQ